MGRREGVVPIGERTMTKRFPSIGVWLIAVAAVFGRAEARTWHILPDGSGDAPTIQAGIDSAAVGDTVLLGCGIYYEHSIQAKPGLCLLSETGEPDCAILDAECAGRAISGTVSGAPTQIKGITIRNGIASGTTGLDASGGGIAWEHSPLILERCFLIGNAAVDKGGGLYVSSADSVRLNQCVFEGNRAGSGGGLALSNVLSCKMEESLLEANWAEAGGGMLVYSAAGTYLLITGSLFNNNTASAVGGIMLIGFSMIPDINAHVVSTTFCGNEASSGGGIRVFRSSIFLDNSIVAFGGEGPVLQCDFGGSAELVCCDVYGNSGGDWVGCIADQAGLYGNFSKDPLFCNAEAGDFSLCADSPCADAPDCGPVGAFGVGCGACGEISVENTSWGSIKSMFR
ncbi:MAG: hypothetical protein ABIH26_06075 [Candidatus Eisenbacteria bacterium]